MSTIYAAKESDVREVSKWSLSMSQLGLAALIAAAYLPLVAIHGQQLWQRPHYQFSPLVLLGAAVLAWTRGRELKRLEPGDYPVRMTLVASAWLVLAGAELLNSSWLAAVAALVFLLAVLHGFGGKTLMRQMLPAWAFLWLLVPPPFGLDYSLILTLQTLTTRWSSTLLDLVGIFHGITGHVIEIGGQQLFVEEACAGINSLFSILACALFYVFYTRMPALRAVVILLASLLWVLLANVIRVFLVAYLLKRWSINLAEGWRHDALGFALFGVALGLIWSTNRLILLLTPFLNKRAEPTVMPAAAESTTAAERPNWSEAWRRSWLNSGIAGTAFGLLLLSHLYLYDRSAAFASGPGEIAACVQTLNEDSLPPELHGWRREKMSEETRAVSNAFGQYSKVWIYRGPSQQGIVSLDYPFAAWHELTECYYGQGWQVEPSSNLTTKDAEGPSHYCEHKMKKAGSRFGHLLFCQFDSTGQIVTPMDRDSVRASLHRQESALKRLMPWSDGPDNSVKQVGSVYQFQLLVETFAPLNPSEQAKAKERFFKAYQHLCLTFQKPQ